jgi:hypothetical protein
VQKQQQLAPSGSALAARASWSVTSHAYIIVQALHQSVAIHSEIESLLSSVSNVIDRG